MSESPAERSAQHHYPYLGDQPQAIGALVGALGRHTTTMRGVDAGLRAALPRLRSSWSAGKAGDDACAAVGAVLDFTATIDPSFTTARSALQAWQGHLTRARSRIDELNDAYRQLDPAQRRLAAFGDWIMPARERAYEAALTEFQVVAARVGYGSTGDIDAAYTQVARTLERHRDECWEVLARQTSALTVPGGRAGSSAFASTLPVAIGGNLGACVDGLIARGILPPETRDLTAEQLAAYLKDHPDVARRLAENAPGPGATGAEAFLYSLTQPGFYQAGADVAAIDRARVREFFEQLSLEDQQLLGTLFPTRVGNLSGATFAARDAGNYVSIVVAAEDQRTRVADLQERLAELAEHPSRYSGAAYGRLLEQLEREQAVLATYQGVIDHPERQIVVFDAKRGAFAEVSGTIGPQTKNVGLICPGTGTNMGGIDGNVHRYASFVDASGGELAMVTWMGGGLPQSILPEAFVDSYSRDLGPRLAEFSQDLRQESLYAAGPPGPKITIAGHSYGGAVVGIAETFGVDADRIMHVESPGMGNDVNSIADYRPVNPDVRRYSMTAPGDPIEMAHDNDLWGLGHGRNPDHMDGVTLLDTGYYADGTLIQGLDAHGGVFREGSDSWRNMYQVFVGGEIVVRPPDEVVYDAEGVPTIVRSNGPVTRMDIP